MSILVILISISLMVAIGFLLSFVWAVKSGQYKDTDAPAVRILYEDGSRLKSKEKITLPLTKPNK